MKKPPPRRPAAPAEVQKPPPENPAPPEEKEKKTFTAKVIIMLPRQQAQELSYQIDELRKKHPELLNGPLGELLDLIK